MNTIEDVVSRGLCISCGACCSTPLSSMSMREANALGMYLPVYVNTIQSREYHSVLFDTCPGKGYDIVQMGRDLYPEAISEDIDLGRWYNAWAGRATCSRLIGSAASGGVMTCIADHLLRTQRVHGVVATRITFGKDGPRPQTFLAQTRDELLQAQGSKYCPVPALELLSEIRGFAGKLLFIGTPCQIAGLRLLQRRDSLWREKIVFAMANFCGGFRDLRETDTLVRRAGLIPSEIVQFRYRGGGQPGSMRMQDKHGRARTLPYPAYSRMTGFPKHLRCRMCVDATGELADFSCGDAWIDRFLRSGNSWSILMTRSAAANLVIEELVASCKVELSDVSVSEIKQSQHGNLTSKKLRQSARRKLYLLFGRTLPKFDEGFPRDTSSILGEAKIVFSQFFLYTLERLSLYQVFAKLIGRFPRVP